MTEDKPLTKKEVNDAIESAKASDPNMATVLGLMDLTYNEGIDDAIAIVKVQEISFDETKPGLPILKQIINSLTNLKK